MKKSKSLLIMTIPVYIFLVRPLLVIVAVSFSDATYLRFPEGGLTLRWYEQILKVKSFGTTAEYSITVALAATLIALPLGLPAVYAPNRYRFKGREATKGLFLSSVLIPVIVLGFAVLRYVASRHHLPALPSLLIGHTILSTPYVMRAMTSSLANFDLATERAARTLGAGQVYTFFRIILPNIRLGIASACIMAVIGSFNDVSLSAFLTSAGVTMLPTEIMAYVEHHFDPTIMALASFLMAITLSVILMIERALGLKSIV